MHASRTVEKPPEVMEQVGEAPAGMTPAQRLVRRAFLCGLGVGLCQIALSGLAFWVVLDLLRAGTLVTQWAILLTVGNVLGYALALHSMTRLRRHKHFRPWLPLILQTAGVALCAAVILLDRTTYLGEGGLHGFFLQPGARAPEKTIASLAPVPLASIALGAAGFLGVFPIFGIIRIHLNAESRRLLKWMALD